MSTYVNISKIIAAGKKKTQLGINKQWVEYDLPGGICCAIRCQLKDTPPAMLMKRLNMLSGRLPK